MSSENDTRARYEITREQLSIILRACRSEAESDQAWGALGAELGFDHLTVRAVYGESARVFTALPIKGTQSCPVWGTMTPKARIDELGAKFDADGTLDNNDLCDLFFEVGRLVKEAQGRAEEAAAERDNALARYERAEIAAAVSQNRAEKAEAERDNALAVVDDRTNVIRCSLDRSNGLMAERDKALAVVDADNIRLLHADRTIKRVKAERDESTSRLAALEAELKTERALTHHLDHENGRWIAALNDATSRLVALEAEQRQADRYHRKWMETDAKLEALEKAVVTVWLKAGPRAIGHPAQDFIEGVYAEDPRDGFVIEAPVIGTPPPARLQRADTDKEHGK